MAAASIMSQKYLSAPKSLPDDLIWFKWEAYLTWVTGFLLLDRAVLFERHGLSDRSGRHDADADGRRS